MESPSLVDARPASQADRTLDYAGMANHTNGDFAGSKVAHTLTACCRCRTRKTRCDPGLPRCGPCERSNAVCEYFDTTKGRNISRSYVIHLQNKVQALEAELAALGIAEYETPDEEIMIRSAGYVRFKENDEAKYLGPSSGIAVSTLPMVCDWLGPNGLFQPDDPPGNGAGQAKHTYQKH